MAIDSSKPSKQRKFLKNMPLHSKRKLLSAHLSKDLRAELGGKRSISLRKGDTVRVMRGENNGIEGKISKIDLAKVRIYVDKLLKKKADGKESFIPLQPSNLLAIDLDRKDSRRFGQKENLKKEIKKSDVK